MISLSWDIPGEYLRSGTRFMARRFGTFGYLEQVMGTASMDGYFVSENYGFRKGYLDHTTTKYINVVLDVVADAKGYDRDNPNTTLYFKDDWTFHVSLEDFQNFKLDEERNKILTAERSKESKKVERDRSLRESIAKMEAELAEMRGQLGDNS